MLRSVITPLLFAAAVASKMTLGDTKFVFAFGDSYTDVVPPGFPSPVPNLTETSSNGPNWIQSLTRTYNVTKTQLTDMAFIGATIDAAIVPPVAPYILPLVGQVDHFVQTFTNTSTPVPWDSSDTLFAIWIGINDLANSQAWTNVTTPVQMHQLNTKLITRLFSQVDILYGSGARSFLFLSVPPIDRTPLFVSLGRPAALKLSLAVSDFNSQLSSSVRTFQAHHSDLSQVTLFDTQPIFNTLLDNAKTFGYVNTTGYCLEYATGTPDSNTQIDPCAPVASYFWINSFHPMYTVHSILAHSIATALSS